MYDDQNQITEENHYEYYHVGEDLENQKKIEREQQGAPQKGVKNGMGFRKTIALGLVFGVVAGTVFHASNRVLDQWFPIEEKKTTSQPLESTETIAEDISDENDTDGILQDFAASEDADQNSYSSISDLAASKGIVAAVANASMPSVVAITTVSVQEIRNFFGYAQEYRSAGSGSGIIVGENDEELLIATNNHVVDGASALSVCFIGDDVESAAMAASGSYAYSGDVDVDNAVSASIKGTDAENDLAIISVKKSDIPDETMNEIKIATLGDSDTLVVGEQVVAIGNALGYGQSVTSGYISALDRQVTTQDGTTSAVLQTDAAINPGNSGGALLNLSGEVIGINSAKYSDEKVEGMGYAIPISRAYPILEELMNRETREKVDSSEAGYLGISVADISNEAMMMYNMPSGAFVIETTQNYAAASAGIVKGDIIVRFDGQTVTGRDDLLNKLSYYAAGEIIEVEIARAQNGEYVTQTLTVTLSAHT